MIKTTTYTNEETAEVVNKKERTVGNQFDDGTGYLFWNRKYSSRQFSDVPFPKDMTDSEIGKYTKLAKCIWRDSNMLAYRGNGGLKPHTIKTIAKVLEISERQSERFVRKMMESGLMAKGTFEVQQTIEVHYFISPLYFFSGKRINNTLYMLFRKQLDPVFPAWVRKKFVDTGGNTSLN